MADVKARRTAPGGRSTNLLLVLLVVVVLGLVVWVVMNAGDDEANVRVNLPEAEAPGVDVDVKSSDTK